MRSHDLSLPALDGRPLAATMYEPDGPVVASLVVLGALGVPRGYYRAFGAWMAERGVAVLTFDYRGCGGSRTVPLRRDPATLLDWARLDASAAIDLAATRWPDATPWGLGHSFGGQAFGLTGRARDLAGVLVVAAGSGDLALYPAADARSIRFRLGTLLPVVAGVFGYVPGRLGLGEDLPAAVVKQWASWCLTPDYVRGALGLDGTDHHRLTAPVHFVEVSDDTYAPARASAALRSWYARAPVTTRVVTPGELGMERLGHFGFFRAGRTEPLWIELHDRVRGVVAAGRAAG